MENKLCLHSFFYEKSLQFSYELINVGSSYSQALYNETA